MGLNWKSIYIILEASTKDMSKYNPHHTDTFDAIEHIKVMRLVFKCLQIMAQIKWLQCFIFPNWFDKFEEACNQQKAADD